jgi:hypothetical protein
MRLRTTRLSAVAVTAVLAFGGVACSDEDGDGATTDEEVDNLEQEVDEGADQVEEEIEQNTE